MSNQEISKWKCCQGLVLGSVPYAVGKQPFTTLINLGRKWTLNR